MLITEFADAQFKYNVLVMQYNKLAEELQRVHGLTTENVLRLANGDFDYKFWDEKGDIKSNDEEAEE